MSAVAVARVAPKPKERHVEALDGVRGIAILLVLAIHSELSHFLPTDSAQLRQLAKLMYSGWTGVDLFFVLSGFLITGILLDTKHSPNRARSFYMRRVLRIFPLYYLGIALAAIIFVALHSLMNQAHATWTPYGWISFLLYWPNWWIAQRPLDHSPFMGHFWSLGVEEQFYLAWPWIVWKLDRKSLKLVCGVLIVGAFLLRLAMLSYLADQSSRLVLMNTFTRMDTLIVGAFCAIAVREPKLLKRVLWISPFAIVACIVGMYWIDERIGEVYSRARYTQLYGYSLLAFGYGACVLWAFVGNGSGKPLDRVLRMAWLRWIGKYSYGIYVYHAIVFMFVGIWFAGRPWYGNWLLHSIALCGFAWLLSFGVAWISYEAIEKRFLRLKSRFRASGA